MRNVFEIFFKKYNPGKWVIPTVIALLIALPVSLQAQTDSIQVPATDSTVVEQTPAEETPELISPSMQFTAVQKTDNSIDLKATLKTKVKGMSFNLYKLKVIFYRVVNEEDQELGFVITDGAGKAVLNIKGDSLAADAEGKLHFKAVFSGNKAMEGVEEVFSFRKAKLEITPVKEDSLLNVSVRLIDMGTGEEVPVKDATIGIYVKRLFLPQKIGEGTTDENGEATVEFPAGLPGDEKGNLILIARIDENETYGYLEASSVQNWGIPVSKKIEEQPRALWSSHPPLWMLITFIVLMLAVWGHYLVIVYELFRLRKENPHIPLSSATN